MRGSTGWIGVSVWLLGVTLGLPLAARAEPRGRVTAVSVAVLNVYDRSDEARPVDMIPREQVPLPLDVHDIAPNKRLKVRIGDRWLWIDRGVVRTKGVQSAPTCGVETAPPGPPSVLAPRGLGKGCK